MSFLKTKDQTEIFFTDQGRGDPVILIHGWPLCSDMWEYQQVHLLEKGFRVIAYDRRGFGRSAQPFATYTYDTFASDLNDLIEHLHLDDVSLVGFSMGGGEIARYLSNYGAAKISRAVLMSSVTPYLFKSDENPDGVPEEKLHEMMAALHQDRPKFLATFGKQFYGGAMLHDSVSSEILDWTTSLALRASPLATIQCVEAFGLTDFSDDMNAFTIPTLIIHGESDKTVPMKATGERAAKLIPGAEFKIYEGAPHGLFITEKDKVNGDLVEFLVSTVRRRAEIRISPRSM